MYDESWLELLQDMEALLALERLVEREEALFLEFSAVLTGFPVFDLRATGMADAYFLTVLNVMGEQRLGTMLAAFARCMEIAEDEDDLNRYVRVGFLSNPLFGPVSRNLIKLWYLGSWYQLPAEWRREFGQSETDYLHVVDALPASRASGTTYTHGRGHVEGLVWKAIKSHPMGAKQPGYGTWADSPITEEEKA